MCDLACASCGSIDSIAVSVRQAHMRHVMPVLSSDSGSLCKAHVQPCSQTMLEARDSMIP